MENKLSFTNCRPCDLAWLSREQVIEMICNTFESELITDEANYIVVKSKWHLLHPDTKYLSVDDKDITCDVYFHLWSDDFIILRGKTHDIVADTVKDFLEKDNSIIDTKKGDYVNGNSFSTILQGRQFYYLHFALAEIERGKEFAVVNGDHIFMYSMLCGPDPTIETIEGEKTISYFSDLLIGGAVSRNKRK